jgi:hypothetical protein
MAASGFTPISLYYSTTASAVPTSGNLANGELGLNIADMKLYAKNSAGTVTLLASNAGASGSVTSVSGTGTVNGLTLTGTVTTSGSLTLGGTLSLVSPPAIGTTTPNVIAFTTATSTVTAANNLILNRTDAGPALVIQTNGVNKGLIGGSGANLVFSGPNGAGGAGEIQLTTTGLAVTGSLSSTTGANFATSSGNVGIGTASPADKLHVKVDGNANNGVRFENADTGSSALVNVKLVSGGADGGIACTSSTYTAGAVITSDCTYVYASGTSSNGLRLNAEASAPIVFGTNNTEKARLSSTGGFGVGTTADPGAGAIYATGNITAYYSSDIKFKENVRDIPDALATVNAIGGKLFDWTDDYIESKGGADGYFVQKADFGVVAQDVQKVFPIAVRTREDGSLAVDYEKLGALAFAAVSELTTLVQTLTARVEALETK